MIACSNRTTFFAPVFACAGPSVSSTSTWCGSRNWPTPRTTSTLRALAMPARPPVSLPTTLSFQPRSLSRSTCGAPNAMPCSASVFVSSITAATCSSAFDGMQPTLRHTPPSVGVALDQHRLHAEVGGAERGAVAARAGAEHEHLALDVGLAGVGRGARDRARARGCRRRRRGRVPAARCAAAPALRPRGCAARGARPLRARRSACLRSPCRRP